MKPIIAAIAFSALLAFVALVQPASAESCDAEIEINSPEFFTAGETLEFSISVKNSPFFSAEYWIEDLNGHILKRKMETSNSLPKSFTPKEDSSAFIIKAEITSSGCTDLNQSDNHAEKLVEQFGSLGESGEVSISFELDSAKKSYSGSSKMKGIAAVLFVIAVSMISAVLVWKR